MRADMWQVWQSDHNKIENFRYGREIDELRRMERASQRSYRPLWWYYGPSQTDRERWAREAEEREAYWYQWVGEHLELFPNGAVVHADGSVSVPGTRRYWREGQWYRAKSPAQRFRAHLSNLIDGLLFIGICIGGLALVGFVLDYIGSRGLTSL